MNISRREFLQMLAVASASGMSLNACESDKSAATHSASAGRPTDPYEIPAFGNVSLMHYTDCHAQLLPIYFREPNINLGVGPMKGTRRTWWAMPSSNTMVFCPAHRKHTPSPISTMSKRHNSWAKSVASRTC